MLPSASRRSCSFLTWATRVQLGNRGQFQIAVGGTAADSNDPDGLANLLDGSLAPSYVRSIGVRVPRIEELLRAGRSEFDPAKRKAIYAEMERVAIEEAPIVGLAWRSQGYAMQKDVSGFKNLPGALSFYSGLNFRGDFGRMTRPRSPRLLHR